jgi:zinc transporter
MSAATPVPGYGSDSVGLICGFLFRRDDSVVPLDSAEATEWLAAHASERADAREGAIADRARVDFVWLHFDLSHTRTQHWLRTHTQLPDEFYEALTGGLRSTRLERTDQSLVAVINDLHFDFSFESTDISTLWLSVDRELVITARQHPLRSVDRLRRAARDGKALHSSSALLEHLLREQADVLIGVVRTVTTRIDQVEDELLSERLNFRRAKLGSLRRLLVRMQRMLAPEPASLLRLLQHPPTWITETDLQELRAATEEFSVVLRDMATLQERIKLLQEEVAAGVNESNSRSLFVLTVVTVLALPINILAGLFGMNIGGVPLSQNPHGFWIVVAIVVSFTLIAAIAFRKRRDD